MASHELIRTAVVGKFFYNVQQLVGRRLNLRVCLAFFLQDIFLISGLWLLNLTKTNILIIKALLVVLLIKLVLKVIGYRLSRPRD